jgi:hypothetical protein
LEKYAKQRYSENEWSYPDWNIKLNQKGSDREVISGSLTNSTTTKMVEFAVRRFLLEKDSETISTLLPSKIVSMWGSHSGQKELSPTELLSLVCQCVIRCDDFCYIQRISRINLETSQNSSRWLRLRIVK